MGSNAVFYPNNTQDLVGQRFGRLLAVERIRDTNVTYYRCVCDCGKVKFVQHVNLRIAKSCGCYRTELLRTVNIRHGMKKTPTWRSWNAMRYRCRNEKSRDYSRYGGRGIVICDRWDVFENFLADMGERPDGTTLDRQNVNGHYEPGNCRWATPVEQSNNKRNNTFLEHGGQRMSVAAWAHSLDISPSLLWWRMSRWGIGRALTTRGTVRGVKTIWAR